MATSKDPAFLFYPSDYMLGTMLFTFEQKGKYMDLLCLLHSKNGYLTERQMKTILDFDNPDDREILDKFDHDENGYFNNRLLKEIIKRQKHKEKQRENIMKRWHPEQFDDEEDNTQDNKEEKAKDSLKKDSGNKQDNKQKKEQTTKKTKKIPPTIQDVKDYCKERKNNIDAEYFIDFYQSKNWMVGKNKMKDWKAAIRTWERNSFNQGDKKADNSSQGNISGVDVDEDEFDWKKRYKDLG